MSPQNVMPRTPKTSTSRVIAYSQQRQHWPKNLRTSIQYVLAAITGKSLAEILRHRGGYRRLGRGKGVGPPGEGSAEGLCPLSKNEFFAWNGMFGEFWGRFLFKSAGSRDFAL